MSMPAAMRMIAQNKIEAYNSRWALWPICSAQQRGEGPAFFTQVGLNLFVDPRLDGPGLNEISKEEWVRLIKIDGEEFLF
jgi:acyl CoA:acetate/3-ketoacid CoA transferase